MTGLRRRVLYRAGGSARLGALALRTGPLARRARRGADRYVGGETLDQALATIDRLHNEGFLTSIDSFGESVTDPRVVEQTVDLYKRINRELDRREPRVNVWVDLSNFGLDVSTELCLRSVRRIAQTLPDGSRLQVRAHDSRRADRVLEVVHRLAADGAPVMATLQAHLRRSPQDADRLVAERIPVLLVKGATVEPRAVAHAWGPETDRAYIELARRLHSGGAELSIGTHDPVIREALIDSLEGVRVEMLLGIRSEDALALSRRGHRVRVYVPFGTDWFRYWLRRLAEARGG